MSRVKVASPSDPETPTVPVLAQHHIKTLGSLYVVALGPSDGSGDLSQPRVRKVPNA